MKLQPGRKSFLQGPSVVCRKPKATAMFVHGRAEESPMPFCVGRAFTAALPFFLSFSDHLADYRLVKGGQ